MENTAELLYTKSHEWVKIEDGKASVGITDHAQKLMGDIVFVDLPEIGSAFQRGDVFSAVESIKIASDIYTPLSGKVAAVNDELADEPGLINSDPYVNFIAVLDISDASEADGLMDESQYNAFCEEEH